MRIQDIIAAKRDGLELAGEEISRIVLEYSSGRVPDYQMSAFLMAAFIRGMSFDETTALTRAMVESGKTLDLSTIPGIKVDKHSTGGVGDKATLVVVPMLAACGLKAAKMSGRGLGHTGGTLDKLESIPGFDTALSMDRFIDQLRNIGAVIAGQSKDIVPADKIIYALRDVTATVESIPLIAASVMSKKIACSADVILLDVKMGSGAFVRDIESARELAQTMIAIGKNLGRRVGAVITDMNQPLGCAVGNALEVVEAIETLRGNGPADFRELCVELCAILLFMTEHANAMEKAREIAVDTLDSRSALGKFREIVSVQGGDVRVVDDLSILPQPSIAYTVRSEASGFVSSIDCAQVGRAASVLGAGRKRKEDVIDPAVGIVVEKKIGDYVENGDVIGVVYADDSDAVAVAASMILQSYELSDKPEAPRLIYETIL